MNKEEFDSAELAQEDYVMEAAEKLLDLIWKMEKIKQDKYGKIAYEQLLALAKT